MKSFRNFWVKSTSECYFWLANKVSTDSNEYFWKFSWKVFRINLRSRKTTFRPLLIQTLKYWKVFEIFWSQVHHNAISDLQTKCQLILTSTFWNFHKKCLESVLGRKVTFRPLLIQTLNYWKVFDIFWSKVHQNAISDLQTKFQLILTSTFWNFHEKCLESVLGRKSHF